MGRTDRKEKQFTLGELTEVVNGLPPMSLVFIWNHDERRAVTGLCSWRGRYNELSIDSTSDEAQAITVAKFLELCFKANGGVFTGWKGGGFEMDRSTTVWGDEEGTATSFAPYEIRSFKHHISIQTIEVC